MNPIALLSAAVLLALPAPTRAADSIEVMIHLISADGIGKAVGTITVRQDKAGVTIEPKLEGLPPGEHGFHLHEKASYEAADEDGLKMAGQAAGGHFDPVATKAHKGPGAGGHRGDLPKLVVSESGVAKEKLAVPGLGLADFHGKALVIHGGGDNYSDAPKPLGGGGERIACGVAK